MEIQGGKFLTFLLGEEVYAIPIKKVKEIIGKPEITDMSKRIGSIVGTIDFRNNLIPIVDLRLKFGMEATQQVKHLSVIVVEASITERQYLVGIIVDLVAEVANIATKDIEPPPEYEAKTEGDFLAGLGKLKGKVILILDCEKILSGEESDYLIS